MIIGIDASRALKPLRTGTELHNAEIIKHLVAIDRKNTYRLYAQRLPFGDMIKLKSAGCRIEWRIMPFFRGWTLFRLSLEMALRPPDILFVSAHILPIIAPRRSVVTIHDLGFDHFPELYKWTDKAYHRFAVRWAKFFASHILTSSEFTRQDLHQRYAIPLEKITTVYLGFDPSLHRPARQGEKGPIPEPYFFFIGRLEHKKNISRMLEAFAQFKKTTRLPHKFLIAGRKGYGHEIIEKTYQSLGEAGKDVVFLGYVGQEEATRYLRHATALVFTTLFEGFGLPVLDAFAAGVPVVTSQVTSLPEIASEAALIVNPRDIKEIARAMTRLAQDGGLRRELVIKGEKRCRQFSWEKTARDTLTVLERIGHA